MSNLDKMYPLWSQASAIGVGCYLSNDWSLISAEELADALEDDENPIILSVYGVDNNMERFEFYFDHSDIIGGEPLSYGFRAKDGSIVTTYEEVQVS